MIWFTNDVFAVESLQDNRFTSTTHSAMFLQKLYDFIDNDVRNGQVIDYIFDEIDDKLEQGGFEEVDQLLQAVDFEKVPPVFLVSFLTITGSGAIKTRLLNRPAFYEKTKAKLVELKKVDPDKILDGLQ